MLKIQYAFFGALLSILAYRIWDIRTSIIKNPIAYQRTGSEDFINPLLDCDTSINTLPEFKPLEKSIDTAISEETSDHRADHVSVYFRSLNAGRWVGINENDQYIGASLIKLPVALAFYKLAETKPDTLLTEYAYSLPDPVSTSITQNILPNTQLEEGKSYTVQNLLDRLLMYSDNASLTALTEHIDTQSIDTVFTDLNLSPNQDHDKNILITPKEYSTFFRVLFNATYLSRTASQYILKVLSQSSFAEGLAAGTPQDIPVSHKFGERTITQENGSIVSAELHDCGIVYLPDHPYFLCVMTRGKRLEDLKSVVKKISKTVYSEMTEYWKYNTK